MIAATVALALALAPGAARQRPPAEPSQTNAARARRGLLPRKLVRRPPSRARRVVLLPASPTWLGEPTGVADPVVVLADAEGAAPEGAARARLAPMAAADAPDEVAASTGPWASAAGTEVSVLLVVRPSGGRGPGPLQAGVAGAEVQAVIRRAAPAR